MLAYINVHPVHTSETQWNQLACCTTLNRVNSVIRYWLRNSLNLTQEAHPKTGVSVLTEKHVLEVGVHTLRILPAFKDCINYFK